MSLFDSVARYITEFDRGFSSRMRGATREELDLLESLVGRRLPSEYVDFAEVMGGSMGGVPVGPFDLSIQRVLEFYKDGKWLPDLFFRIGDGTTLPPAHPHLKVLDLFGEDEEVVLIPDYSAATFQQDLHGMTPWAGSLVEMICMPVFDRNELDNEERQSVILQGPKSATGLARAETTLEGLGFTKHWFSSPTGRAFWRTDGAAKAVQTYLGPLTVSLSAESIEQRDRMVEQIQKELGLRRVS